VDTTIWRGTPMSAPFSASSASAIVAVVIVVSFRSVSVAQVPRILEPTKVARTALQNASSVAARMLTTEAMVAETRKDETAPPGGGRALHPPATVLVGWAVTGPPLDSPVAS
jgi:hypothetical protein